MQGCASSTRLTCSWAHRFGARLISLSSRSHFPLGMGASIKLLVLAVKRHILSRGGTASCYVYYLSLCGAA